MEKSDARKAAEEWYKTQVLCLDFIPTKATALNGYLAGYNAGLEDAGKLCDERARQLREDMPGKPAAITNSLSLARLIRTLKEGL